MGNSPPRVLLLYIAVILTISSTVLSEGSKLSFAITIKAPQSVKAGSKAFVDVKVTNVSNHVVSFGLVDVTRGEFDFDFEVRDSQGNLASETKYARAVKGEDQGIGSRIVIMTQSAQPDLKPGETLQFRADLSELFDLKPGKYTVQLTRAEGAYLFSSSQQREDTDLKASHNVLHPPVLAVPSPKNNLQVKSNMISIAVVP